MSNVKFRGIGTLLSVGPAIAFALFLMAGLGNPHVAEAASGQCRWEGGPGAPTYAYCKAEDCVGSGGTALCSAGAGAPTDGSLESLLGPDKWSYHLCEEAGPSIPRDARWCAKAGGTWVDPVTGCVNLPAGFIGYTGQDANNEQVLIQTANNYENCSLASDTGWGGYVSSYECWSGSPASKLGIYILDHRQRVYSGPSCGGTVTFLKIRDAKCPAGYRSRNTSSGKQCFLPLDCCGIGHPISPLSGAKTLAEVDYAGPVSGGLEMRRYYRSTGYYRPYQLSTMIDSTDHMLMGDFWRFSYDRRLYAISGNSEVSAIIQRPDGSPQEFDTAGHEIVNVDGAAAQLQFTAGVGWDLTLASRDVEHYDVGGRLTSVQTRTGLITTLTYGPTGKLSTVADAFGHALSFGYDTDDMLTSITLPDGGQVQYAYDNWNRLTTVTYPDTTTRTYSYGDTYNNWLITGIQDESGQQYVSYAYDAQGRAISESLAGGADPYTFAYNSGGTGSTVTDPTGAVTQWTYSSYAGVYRSSSHSQPCRDCGAVSNATYDAQGNPSARTDFNGNQSVFIYDSTRNLETWRTEAAGTPQARVITTQWHPTFRAPTQIDRPGQRTTFAYDQSGNLLTKTITDTSSNTSRTWTYTYNALGQVLTIDGPRTDVSDVTTNTYNECTSGYGCGQLATVTDASGNVTTYLTYDANGNPLTMSDANGIVTTLAYDARQRLTSRTTGTETTSYEYWPTGLLKKVTSPDASYVSYAYDAAHRLTGMTDGEGNRIAYTLDAAGNRTKEEAFDGSNALARTRSWVFDDLGRPYREIGAAGQTTTYAYDDAGNVLSVTNPKNVGTQYEYDALNRRSAVLDALGGVTQYAYDSRDNLVGITDPRGLQTAYVYDGFDGVLHLGSPDTGSTDYTREETGNVSSVTDARSSSAGYSYDPLGRVTQIQYSDQTIQFTYDTGTNARGRLSGFSDRSGSTQYAYDSMGHIASKTQTTGSVVRTVGYGYNAAGQLTSITTPSGQALQYSYDGNGRISGISLNGTPLITGVLYAPFGPTRGWQWGNGTLSVREYDTDGQLTTIDSAGLSTYTYYADGTIQSRSDDAPSPDNALSASATINVSATSNRIDSTVPGSSGAALNYSYDAAGNTTSDGVHTFTYDDAGRMTVSMSGTPTTFAYNALGQRVKKVGSAGTVYFTYDESGHLLGEYDASGNLIEELAWFGDIPIASIRKNTSGGVGVFYIHTDNLNTPVRLTRVEDNVIMWRWDHDAYGGGAPDEDADGNGAFVFFNLRFPGQYADLETGLNYNQHRDYDSATGRYVESDPLGFDGGINTYAYVGGDPIWASDPQGLLVAIVGHIAASPLGRLTSPTSGHLALWLEPDNPCECSDVPAMQTIGAQPVSGKLVTMYNYPNDSPNKAAFIQLLDPPPGMSDCEFIKGLIDAAHRYSSNLPYSLPHNLAGRMDAGEYNSNSFVAGVLQAAGVHPPVIDTGGKSYQFPGYQNPIPLPRVQ